MLSKLKIIAYSDNELRSKTGDYTLQINPKTVTHSHSSSFSPAKGSDAAGTILKFHTQKPQEMSFDFVIDTTGVVPGAKSVASEIEKFRNIAYTFQGKIHSPNYLKIIWGGLAFKCMLTRLNIAYQLFAPTGKPLRAKLSVGFRQHQTPEDLTRRADKKSADLTHFDIATTGMTLPLMAYRVYDRPDLYVEVARANDLNDLVHLTAGQSVRFPPYEETADA
ncbi:hypothetical protein [uncultured Roseovarius sp.]|uniref:LysM peptidoglycan-binding domain-containing protein n=1 Tax=uncultured Roseovarius sp. TaxID=293344 RepID=UPI0026340F2B|nr:hypothetical protein [uncultured Roseovarius sp.]